MYREEQDMCAHIPYCQNKGGKYIEPEDCENCEHYHSKYKKIRADLIRAMTDEELADFLYATWKQQDAFSKDVCEKCPNTNCQPKCWLDWLKQKAEEGE